MQAEYPIFLAACAITTYNHVFFFVAEIYAELDLSQVLIKEGGLEVPRPTEELGQCKELERKEKLTLLELHGGLFL